MSNSVDTSAAGATTLPTEDRLRRRTTFDDDAERYARTRPTYPAELFDAFAEATDLHAGSRALEVAPGTGQATVPMAERGWSITAVELGVQMAALARRALSAVPAADVDVVVAPFEDWPLPSEPYDAALCATAWHWLDPAVRAQKAAAALRPGGVLGVVRSHHVAGGSQEFFTLSNAIWRRYSPQDSNGSARFRLLPEEQVEPATAEFEECDAFSEVTWRGFPLEVEYSTAQFLDLISTYSQVAVLPPQNRAALLQALRALADDRFGGRITRRYLFELVLARTPLAH
ncbi:Methyltransferase domain-containing protein [Quadrisphaera granulorum]|uniref:Methyltransferase family protein n=1 Tax=Quadrisphaera granulorum TaxID=317664 RepID=A0A316AVU5_9ACTN|nr:class I SAM-dependent methyltransferase [Quadrisphaera granulorum]PWJ54237.1 methyltransferase family protein [Quadrisphaera granulorum]SZE96376.1 Methyltransferase domain-containing protein [Quadrisphaera granulorum]